MEKPSKEMKLEERIECVLCTQELELDGNAYMGKYELNDFGSIKKFILSNLHLDKKSKPIAYTNQSTGDEISISHEAAGKLAGHPKDGEVYGKVAIHIPQIIEQMQFLEEMDPDKGNDKADKYSYYITAAKIDGESYTILSTVKRKRGEVYYEHNIFNGRPENVFAEAKKKINEPKYRRLNKILQNTENEKGQLETYPGSNQGALTASNSKYSKKF